MLEDGVISKSQPKVRQVELGEEGSDFECYDKSEGKQVHVDIDKETTEENKSTLAPPLSKRSEEDEIKNNDETRDGDAIINLRRSNRIFKPPERLGSVPYF